MAQESRFKRITQFTTDYSPSTITKYESTKIGMSTVVVDRQSPKVLGYFTVATEIFDDSGAPHTLEHLIFMGSKSYRYKGFLDRLASRAYSDTNAWTDTDQTVYELESAGWKGFSSILPVYLEHLLLPTMTDAACYTEVHHVDGDGKDAGVVYSEMQGVQNTSGSLMDLEMQRLLYPEDSGYRYETGGMMENLRVLTADRIREFHKAMYDPKNITLVIIGEVDHGELLKILEDFEDKLDDRFFKPDPEWKRPWVDSKLPPTLPGNTVSTVEFPEEDESMGEVMVSWLGPDCRSGVDFTALDVLSVFLAGSSVSLLEAALVENEDAVASSVYLHVGSRPKSQLTIYMSGVETKRLAEAERRLFDTFKKAVKEGINLEYMRDCVRRTRRTRKHDVETAVHYFSGPIIVDSLYGKRSGENLTTLKTLEDFDTLEAWTEDQWKSYINKWFVENRHVSVLGKPSAKLAKKIEDDENSRIEEQIKKLGPKGLAEKAKRLSDAKAENERVIPKEILEDFKIPPVDSINFITTKTGRAGLARKDDTFPKDPEDTDVPLYLHYESIPSNFVQISIILSTGSVPEKLKALLPVYQWNFFSTAIKDGSGKVIDYESVVKKLESETVGFSIQQYDRAVGECLKVSIQVEPENYEKAIQWLKDLLWNSVFEEKRLSVQVAKLYADIPEEKRDGGEVKRTVLNTILFTEDGLNNATGTFVKARTLRTLKAGLSEDPESILSKFKALRDSLCKPENMRILVIGDVEKLETPVSVWKMFLPYDYKPGKLAPIDRRTDKLSPEGKNPSGTGIIVPMATIDSTFSSHVTKAPSSKNDPLVPAIAVAISYLGAVEGPLWVAVRGAGLAYGSHFQHDKDAGLLQYSVYRSPDAAKAFAAAKKIVTDFATGKTPIDENAFEAARSAIAVHFADQEPTFRNAAESSFVNQAIWGLSKNYNKEFLKKVEEVTPDDMRNILQNLFLNCFDGKKSITVVTSSSGKVDMVVEGFEREGINLQKKAIAEFDDGGDADDEDSEDESEAGAETGSDSEEEEDDGPSMNSSH